MVAIPVSSNLITPSPSFIPAISHRSSANGCKCKHSSSPFRPQAMQPPPPSQRPPSEGRGWRGQVMEETVPLWTVTELMHLTRDELCDLADRIVTIVPELEAGSLERLRALTSLDNIRRVMALRDLHP
jgi:hypothetical protein